MTTVFAPPPAYATLATRPVKTTAQRRRSEETRIRALSEAGAGAASLAATQQLPFTARASVRVSNSLLYPILGAVVGSLLLGLPGTILGGVAGWLVAR